MEYMPPEKIEALRLLGDKSRAYFPFDGFIQVWYIWVGGVLGKVMVESGLEWYSLGVEDSSIWVFYGNMPI